MVYTSGIISDINKEESLEQLQDNKLGIVCEKIELKPGETLLDIGCGWGTLAKFASVNYDAHVTGITLGRNQTAWGNNGLRKSGIAESQSKILCMDYRDIPEVEGGYKKITCLEMAEHVGVRHLSSFFSQVHNMLDDDGVFYLQIAGLRKTWQYEDFIWGMFMNKYIFPGADASTPLGFVVDTLEGAGFEIRGIDTVGVHYSATLWRWYRNWMANREKVEAKYGKRWFRVSRCIRIVKLYAERLLDLGIFPVVFHHRLAPRHSKLLAGHLCEEHQLHPPCRGHPCSIRTSRRARSFQEFD
jgi:cyclopropane-fatty-acyl-phospholipid synthase